MFLDVFPLRPGDVNKNSIFTACGGSSSSNIKYTMKKYYIETTLRCFLPLAYNSQVVQTLADNHLSAALLRELKDLQSSATETVILVVGFVWARKGPAMIRVSCCSMPSCH